MKRYLLLLFMLPALCPLQAQIVGDISVTRRELIERDGELCLGLDIAVNRDVVSPTESWTIIPELSTIDRASVMLFPHVLINGRYQQRMLERRRRLVGSYLSERQPYIIIQPDGKSDRTFHYEMKVPFEEWMLDASLVVRQIWTSKGNHRRVFTIDVNGAVIREH